MQRLRKRVPFAILLLVLLAAVPAAATDVPVGPLKYGAELLAKKAAGEIYKSECSGNIRADSPDALVCGAMGSFSGEAEKEWKQNVTKKLAEIESTLADLDRGMKLVLQAQRQMLSQNEQILLRLDEVAGETVVTDSLAEVGAIWDDEYEPLIRGEKEFNRDRLLAFARSIALKNQMSLKLGKVHQVLTRPTTAAKLPLLAHYMYRMDQKLLGGPAPPQTLSEQDLSPVLDFVEAVLTQLLTQQREGYVMYVWAAEVLEADCEVNGACEARDQLAHTAAEYHKIFQRHLAEQLAAYNTGVERMVLERSAYVSPNSNFLKPDAVQVFARADLFTAANLGQTGPRGRVVSMGNAWDGKIRIGGRTLSPEAAPTSIPVAPNIYQPGRDAFRVDWWRATGSDPGVYDELHLANHWKVYRYGSTGLGTGQHRFESALPYHPEQVRVSAFDLLLGEAAHAGQDDEAIVPLGSFTAVERAGGAYAFQNGTWTPATPVNESDYTGDVSKSLDPRSSADPLYALVDYQGRVSVKRLGDNRAKAHIVQTLKRSPIRFADGGEMTLLVNRGSNREALCPAGNCVNPGLNENAVAMVRVDYSGTDGATARARAGLAFDSYDSSKRAVGQVEANNVKEPFSQDESRIVSAKIRFEAGKTYTPLLFAEVEVDIPTFLTGTSTWSTFAVVRPLSAYLVP